MSYTSRSSEVHFEVHWRERNARTKMAGRSHGNEMSLAMAPKTACTLYPTASSAWDAFWDVSGILSVAPSRLPHEHL